MTAQQYADDLVAKSCKVADVYDDWKLKNVFIEGVDACIRHSLRHYLARNPQADLTDIDFQAYSLLSIQREANATPENNQNNLTSDKLFNRKPLNSRKSANNVSTSATSPA